MSVVVIHTTESDAGTAQAVARYLVRQGIASNEVYDPSNDETISLIPAGSYARALVNAPGGVETNRRETDGRPGADVYQIEVVGRAADVAGYGEAWYQNLAHHVALVCWLTGTPLEFPCQFVAYPRPAYGASPYRLTPAQWQTVQGVIGHQHVPENAHGDPGDISRLVSILTPITPKATMTAPIGTIDLQTAEGGRIRVVGWALDPDSPSVSIRVDFHVWDQGHLKVTSIPTNVVREDVNAAYGVTGAHGFNALVDLPAIWREPTVIFYGIDAQGVTNAELARSEVKVQA